MKRLHLHVNVEDLAASIEFYATLFDARPSVEKPDYAKWLLDDPRVNFVIATHCGRKVGPHHFGIQVDSRDELEEISERLTAADKAPFKQTNANCCYAVSDKAWVADPQGLKWETFHTTGELTEYGKDRAEIPRLASAQASHG